jgi:ABC-type spermidine/putrescine transport system permease subunit II
MMVGGTSNAGGPGTGRPWTFYALAALFGLYLLFLYGPMLVIYVLSFQGPNGGVTFPMVGTSLNWFPTFSSRARWRTSRSPSPARSSLRPS